VADIAFDAAGDGATVVVEVVVVDDPADVSVAVVFFSQATSNVAAAITVSAAMWVLLAFIGFS
jgi:hypothetical protein